MNKLVIILAVLLLSGLIGCQSKKKQSSEDIGNTVLADSSMIKIRPRYAQGFQVTYTNEACLLDIQDPQHEENASFRYALVPRGTKPGRIPSDYTIIETPIRNAICMTSLQLSNFIKLGEVEHIVGITSTRHLFNQEVKQRIKEGKIHQIGIEGNFDNEVIMAVNPDLILISPFKRGGYDALKEVGIPLMPHLGYKEMTPLGQAEWIKFIGLLLGEEDKANSLFATIEARYNALKELTMQVDQRPIVFSGELRGGNWYAVGGKSFLAQLFKDAGADYFLKDDERSGGIMLDFETVYSQAAHADYWRIVNSHKGGFTYDVLQKEDARYADFQAFKDRKVLYCNMSEKPFYESMPTQPEVVLADLIKVFYPQLLPDYQPTYYELLK